MQLTQEQMQQTVAEFHRDGVALVPAVLTAEECAMLRAKTDQIFADEQMNKTCRHPIEFVISNPLLQDRVFADLFMREPILSLMEIILGKECRFCGQSIIRNEPGKAITHWHIDDGDIVDFPLPDSIPRHDARVTMPVFWLSVQIPLTDIESQEDGPTEIVRGSHYAGRMCPTQENPQFDGRGPEPIFCKAGDAYLFNHQLWHRGSPNQSQRTRYLLQLQYARGGMRVGRFQGLAGSPQLDAILQGADERMLRVLGRTPPI